MEFTTINRKAQGNRRKAKRSLQKVLPPIIKVMAAIREKTGKTATCEQVAAELHTISKGDDGKDTKTPVFTDARDVGSYIAGSVARMNDAESIRHGTTLHKMATVVLETLKGSSDSSNFSVGSGSAAEMESFIAGLGVDVDGEDSLENQLQNLISAPANDENDDENDEENAG